MMAVVVGDNTNNGVPTTAYAAQCRCYHRHFKHDTADANVVGDNTNNGGCDNTNYGIPTTAFQQRHTPPNAGVVTGISNMIPPMPIVVGDNTNYGVPTTAVQQRHSNFQTK